MDWLTFFVWTMVIFVVIPMVLTVIIFTAVLSSGCIPSDNSMQPLGPSYGPLPKPQPVNPPAPPQLEMLDDIQYTNEDYTLVTPSLYY